jgi:hypothetical protein
MGSAGPTVQHRDPLGLAERDIRRDGSPRKHSREPSRHGGEISFDSPGPPRPRHHTCGLRQDNVRSIALALQVRRAVDGFGTRRGERYAGFTALPAAGGTDARSSAHGRRVLGDVLRGPRLERRGAERRHPHPARPEGRLTAECVGNSPARLRCVPRLPPPEARRPLRPTSGDVRALHESPREVCPPVASHAWGKTSTVRTQGPSPR